MKILYLSLDFENWQTTQSWSWATKTGLFHSSASVHVDRVSSCWLPEMRSLTQGKRYDILAFEIFGSPLTFGGWPDWFVDWARSIAPIRLGVCMENLMAYDRTRLGQKYGERWFADITKAIEAATHLALVVESDVAHFQAKGIPSIWVPPSMPDHLVANHPYAMPDKMPQLVFSGARYSFRESILAALEADNLVGRRPRPKSSWIGKCIYDTWCLMTCPVVPFDVENRPHPIFSYISHLNKVKYTLAGCTGYHALADRVRDILREQDFKSYLDRIRSAYGLFSPPTEGALLPSRIYECMAIGLPIVAWIPPASPRAESLFEHGKEILWYREGDGSDAKEQILRLLSDYNFAQEMAKNGIKKVKAFHTASARTKQILDWLETGETPSLS